MYIACAGERLLLLKVECRERSGRNNGSDLAIEVRLLSVGIQSKGCSRYNIFSSSIEFFIMRKDCSSQMTMSAEKDPLRALPWYQCFTRVCVGPASCATLMNCYSNMNLVSRTMVDALNLPLMEHP